MKNLFLLLVFFLFVQSISGDGETYSNIIIYSIVYLFVGLCEIKVNGKSTSSSLYIYIGSSINLQCACQNNVTVKWYHNGSLFQNNITNVISLNLVSRSKSGTYRCKGQNNITHEINITVYCK